MGMGGMKDKIDETLRLKAYYHSLLSNWHGFGSQCTISTINRIVLGLSEEEKSLLIDFVNAHKALDCSTKETERSAYRAVVNCLKQMTKISRYEVDQGYGLTKREDKG